MKTLISKLAAAFFILALTCSAPVMHAQSSTTHVKVNVPFAFEIDSRHFEPGAYDITLPNAHMLSIHGASTSALTMINADSGVTLNAEGKVTFRKIGEKYFLHAVALRGEAITLTCIRTSAEQKAQKIEMAATHTAPSAPEVAVLTMPN